jgi:transposase InsO family protein
MFGMVCFVLAVLAAPFKSKSRLEAENAVLRHQLIVLRRKMRGRVRLTNNDRWFLIQLYRWFPSILQVLTIVQPKTLVRWHRAGFRCYWRWKSRPRGGRPQIETDLRALIWQMSMENPLWGAPRIHGELLKLGFEVAQSSVAKYMVKRRGPPSQGWRTFLRNHAPDIAAMDLFVVPTIGFNLLYAFVIVRLGRRDLVWINVTTNPTAEWIARQLTEAFPWNEAPRYLIRDRDRIYGGIVMRRIRAMGIRDRPTAPGSPWQNGFAERLIGSMRRECVNHFIVLGEAHLRRILPAYAGYYNDIRTHRSLDKDAPVSRPVQRIGIINSPRSWADFITTTSGFRFSVHTGGQSQGSHSGPRPFQRGIFAQSQLERQGGVSSPRPRYRQSVQRGVGCILAIRAHLRRFGAGRRQLSLVIRFSSGGAPVRRPPPARPRAIRA